MIFALLKFEFSKQNIRILKSGKFKKGAFNHVIEKMWNTFFELWLSDYNLDDLKI